MPPAPPTFSITTCWPKVSDRRRPMMRPSTSVPPPAANGTTMVTGRFGQSSAGAGAMPCKLAANANSSNRDSLTIEPSPQR